MAIPSLLRESGVDVDATLEPFGLTCEYFEDPENRLPTRTLGQLFGHCAKVTGCGHFGLMVGERAGMPSLGAVGYLMQSSPTVGTALEILSANLRAHDRGGIALVEQRTGYAGLGYAVVDPEVEHTDQILAASLAIIMNILRGLCGAHWQPTEVLCGFAAPRNSRPFRTFFGLGPRFDSESSLLVFEEHWLSRPLPSADPLLHLLMRDRVRQLLGESGYELSDQLRRFLRVKLTSGACTLESAARYFGMHSRALRRRLEGEGTSFRQVLDEVRFEAARQMLRHTHMPVSEIASALGYAEAGAFTRAFARLAGMAPIQWRATAATAPLSTGKAPGQR